MLPGPASVLASGTGIGARAGTPTRFDNLERFTVASLVFTPNTGSGVLGRGFIGKRTSVIPGWFMRVLGTLNYVVIQTRATTSTSFTTTDLPVLQGVWQYFVGQVDTVGNTAAVWTGTLTSPMRACAGTLSAGSGAVVSASGAELCLMAREADVTTGYAGRFAFIALWERYLSPVEIEAIRSTDLRLTSPAGLWYPGRNALGLLLDESGNGNHGTLDALDTLAESSPAGLIAQHHGALGIGL